MAHTSDLLISESKVHTATSTNLPATGRAELRAVFKFDYASSVTAESRSHVAHKINHTLKNRTATVYKDI